MSWPRARIASIASIASLVVLTLPMVGAAAQSHDHHGAAHAHNSAGAPLSALAREQIDSARVIIARFDTPAKARAAGYTPVFGDVPLQGEHYVNRSLVERGEFDIAAPSMLMFTRHASGDSVVLVGAAYGYHVPDSAPEPLGFDGDADVWHEHPMLARRGHRLTMVHLWLEDTPDGPFAHDNVMLPFAARGMALPDSSWLQGTELRDLALALALADQPGERLAQSSRAFGGPLYETVTQERARIDSLATQLSAARSARDRDRYRALAARAVSHSEQLLDAIRTAPPTQRMRDALGRLVDEFIGRHARDAGH
jgi:hypothetical protein